jgi:hypothetical protein
MGWRDRLRTALAAEAEDAGAADCPTANSAICAKCPPPAARQEQLAQLAHLARGHIPEMDTLPALLPPAVLADDNGVETLAETMAAKPGQRITDRQRAMGYFRAEARRRLGLADDFMVRRLLPHRAAAIHPPPDSLTVAPVLPAGETTETPLPVAAIHTAVAGWPDDLRDDFEERAAIIEYDGREPREVAERRAYGCYRAVAESRDPSTGYPLTIKEHHQ